MHPHISIMSKRKEKGIIKKIALKISSTNAESSSSSSSFGIGSELAAFLYCSGVGIAVPKIPDCSMRRHCSSSGISNAGSRSGGRLFEPGAFRFRTIGRAECASWLVDAQRDASKIYSKLASNYESINIIIKSWYVENCTVVSKSWTTGKYIMLHEIGQD